MAKSFLKFRLLLWKNFLIQKRKPIATVFEIGLPTLFSLILMALRLSVDSTLHKQVTQWQPCSYQRLDSTLEGMKLAFTPYNEATERVMRRVNKSLHIRDTVPFHNEDGMVNFITLVNDTGGKHINNSQVFLGGIVFNSRFHIDNGTLVFGKKVDFTIRLSYAPRLPPRVSTGFKADSSWSTNFMFPPYPLVGPREPKDACNGNPGYKREGFLAVQHAIDDSLMHEFLSKDALDEYKATKLYLQRHPYPPYKEDKYVLVLQQQFPMVIMLSLLIIVLGIVRDVVLEKERRLKETMKMMGINNWLHWAAWFTKHVLFILISVVIMTIFFCVPLDSEKGGVVAETNPFIVFLYLFCFSLATITFCFAVSCFFVRANTGAAIGGILFFCLYIPQFFLQNRYTTMSLGGKVLACLDFQLAMAFGGVVLGQFEGVGAGIQLDTIAQGVSVDDNFSMLIVLGMLLFDSLLHCLIAWYVEAVFPGEYGMPQPWYFPFQLSYWGCGQKTAKYEELADVVNVGQDPNMFEKEPSETAGIQIKNLRKVYGRGDKRKVAVAGMTLNMYEGQITALLGHNGAGKTTTMSMLSGFYPPTSGTAIINGFDISTQISEVRSSLGLCPQHDILFDNLTVEEHMKFFGLLKGVSKSRVIPECEEMLRDMELLPKLKAKSKTLSGGMKRKLSVCIALIGNSKVVFLDEPSSGLDPNARRNIWTVLQKNRAGRTMILSTHFMDEADLLGDRIAIMAEGVVKCCGSSLFLKKKYGAGYHMVVVKDATCNVKKVVEVVKSHIDQAEMESNVGAELSFILPQESVSKFEGLFSELEKQSSELGISSFGASVTTMEEVFLKVGESADESIKPRLLKQSPINGNSSMENSREDGPILNGSAGSEGASNLVASPAGAGSVLPLAEPPTIVLDLSEHTTWTPAVLDLSHRPQKNTDSTLYLQQFFAMFLKRILHTLRNKLVTITQLVVPLFFTIMGLVVLKTMPSLLDMPALKLSVDEFGSNYLPYASGLSTKDGDMARSYAQALSWSSHSKLTYVNDVPGYEKDPDVVKYLVQRGKDGIAEYNLKYMVAADFDYLNASATERRVTAFFNNQAFHSIAVSLEAMFNGLLQYYTNGTEHDIRAVNEPLPRLAANKIKDQQDGFKDPTGFTIGFNLSFGMAFLASSFVLFLVKERSVKAKHVQLVSGVHPIMFWLSTLCWDIINFLVPCVLLIASFFAFSITNFTHDLHWLQLLLLFALYGWAMLPYMYFFSFAFSVPSTAYVWITMFNILTGVATLLVVLILSIPQIGLQDVSMSLEWIFMAIFPNYCLSQGLFDLYQNYDNLHICSIFITGDLCPFIKSINETSPCCPGNCGDMCLNYNEQFLGWEKGGIGRMLVFLVLQGSIMWALIFLFEFGVIQKLRYLLSAQRVTAHPPGVYMSQMSRDRLVQEDDDVAKERSRIDNTDKSELLSCDKLVLDNLTKYYGSFRAVDHLSVGIPAGECFGLLGINGAGKSSTFMMLTGDSAISGGEAFLDSYSLKTQVKMARKKLGYCPQFDALIGQLTGRETLTLFARLRGIVEREIPRVVENMMSALTLTQYADKQCQTYSGGNKRKLSTAIALIGDPDVIFLDEPTTGMDPVARRMLWEVLSMVRDSGRTLVLTSHSMEECEALCTRLAIMVNGHFKCLGSIQHLKTKFGEGYTFNAKVSYPEDGREPDLAPLREFMETTFPACKLTDIHENMVNYHITDPDITWAELFGKMESVRERLHIEDYLVSQTSLEQVFIYFARMQVDPESLMGTSSGGCWDCLPCVRNGERSSRQVYTRFDSADA